MNDGTARLRRSQLCVVLILCITLVLFAIAPWTGMAKAPALQATPRDLEPVILAGSDLPLLQGLPTDELYVYAYSAGTLQQIPFQVDEVTDAGAYSQFVGNPLGPTDEIVFMASDLGAKAPILAIQNSLPISPTWYQIEVTDPLSPALKGWAYVVHSSTLAKSFGSGYVSFDTSNRQIVSDQYVVGFATSHPGYSYLALNGSGIDILDRTKLRLETSAGPITEDTLGAVSIGFVKGGPVRAIVRDGDVIGYRGLIEGTLSYAVPVAVTTARASLDFSAAVVPSTLYNANTPTGVTIDGQPDAVAATPLSPWWQVTGNTGTLIQVVDTSQVGGTLANYYMDDETPNSQDRGDLRSYGDVGILATNPNQTLAVVTVYAILPPGLPNVGETYASHLLSPLQIAASSQNAQTQIVRLPVLLR